MPSTKKLPFNTALWYPHLSPRCKELLGEQLPRHNCTSIEFIVNMSACCNGLVCQHFGSNYYHLRFNSIGWLTLSTRHSYTTIVIQLKTGLFVMYEPKNIILTTNVMPKPSQCTTVPSIFEDRRNAQFNANTGNQRNLPNLPSRPDGTKQTSTSLREFQSTHCSCRSSDRRTA